MRKIMSDFYTKSDWFKVSHLGQICVLLIPKYLLYTCVHAAICDTWVGETAADLRCIRSALEREMCKGDRCWFTAGAALILQLGRW